MKEFYWWVLVVTSILVLLGFSAALALHADKQVRKAEIILQRAEQLEKKRTSKIEPKKDE